MAHAIRIHETGGPEVLRWDSIDVPTPAPGEVRVRHTAIGLNFIDTYHRSGLYPLPSLPAILGREAAGTIEAVGAGVTGLAPGTRVAHCLAVGSYTEVANVPAERVVRLPDSLDDRQAAAVLLKGLTAHYLVRRTHVVRPGETILVHAAAGGVGSLLCRWASARGAVVIGTVGSPAKAAIAREHGCDHPVLYRDEDVVARVRELTGGRGVPVVYDSVGRDTFEASLDCLAPLGLLVSFGQSSGPIPPLNLGVLAQKGSLFVTRPTLATYVAERADLERAADELFDAVAGGTLTVDVSATYPLREAQRAHRDLEARRTTGSVVLLP